MIDWRSLLDAIGVEWRDRGPNTSQGNINVGCPFCGDDPSYHLSISETDRGYYCYRDPRHSGTNTTRLLVRLGVDYGETATLLNTHNTNSDVAAPVRKPASVSDKEWQRFISAGESPAATNYLCQRGLPTPVVIARQYDLRVAPAGVWAQRVLIPIRHNDQLVTWVGRAIRDGLEPKYLMKQVAGSVIYAPRRARDVMIVVEGALDALKVAVATEPYDVSSVALLGHGLSGSKITQIADIAKHCSRVFVVLDTDRDGRYLHYATADCYAIVHELATHVTCPVERLEVPAYHKDPGELTLEEITEWLGL